MSPKPRRIFVLDTNVLLYDPNALFVFAEHVVAIPIVVIEEIDRFKKDLNETGRNARVVSRHLDNLRSRGGLGGGVPLEDGGELRVVLSPNDVELPRGFGSNNDNLILATALDLRMKSGGVEVVVVTRDVNMRIKADALQVRAEDYKHAQLHIDVQYTGFEEREVDGEVIDAVHADGGIVVSEPTNLYPHQFVHLVDRVNPRHTAIVRYRGGEARRMPPKREPVWGLQARNKEQAFALELLLDDSVPLVTIDGMAGTGKTLLAIAAGLQKAADEKRYRRLVVSRPIFPLGRDLGYLPGDVREKLDPWMKPVFDNLELLIGSSEESRGNRRVPGYQMLLDQHVIEVEPLTYIRGRSINQQFLIVDEAQNLTPHEVKTVITRAGEGTKVVLTGDPYQIDNPYVDAVSNGLTYVIEHFKRSPLAGHVTLRKGERSELARAAAEML